MDAEETFRAMRDTGERLLELERALLDPKTRLRLPPVEVSEVSARLRVMSSRLKKLADRLES